MLEIEIYDRDTDTVSIIYGYSEQDAMEKHGIVSHGNIKVLSIEYID